MTTSKQAHRNKSTTAVSRGNGKCEVDYMVGQRAKWFSYGPEMFLPASLDRNKPDACLMSLNGALGTVYLCNIVPVLWDKNLPRIVAVTALSHYLPSEKLFKSIPTEEFIFSARSIVGNCLICFYGTFLQTES